MATGLNSLFMQIVDALERIQNSRWYEFSLRRKLRKFIDENTTTELIHIGTWIIN